MGLSVAILADSKFPIDRRRLRLALASEWERSGGGANASVSVAVVGRRKMRELERRYRGVDEPTDVLSFQQQGMESNGHGFIAPPETSLELGDIVVCYPLVVEQAAKRNVLVDDRLEELAIHGLRSLMGFEEILV